MNRAKFRPKISSSGEELHAQLSFVSFYQFSVQKIKIRTLKNSKKMSNAEEKVEASSTAPPPPSPPWVELPAEITIDILQRLGTIEILESAQRVCSTWWKVCHDPAMWRVIDLKRVVCRSKLAYVLEKICRLAVRRSQGQTFKISIDNFGNERLLSYIASRY